VNRRYFITSAAALVFAFSSNSSYSQARGARQPRSQNQRIKPGANRTAAALRTQSERFGGHLNNRHVGKTRAYLKGRHTVARSNIRSRSFRRAGSKSTVKQEKFSALQKANRSLEKQRSRKYSTFSNSATAERAISIAITNNREKIKNFMRSKNKQTTIFANSKTNLGTVYSGKNGKFKQSNKARFLLRKSGSRYYIHTGYPI